MVCGVMWCLRLLIIVVVKLKVNCVVSVVR